jgi:RNA polymerase sigma-70 factor (ECF subfamily)
MNGLPIATALPATLPRSAAERLATLFDAHHERLYRLARRLVPTADDARDLVQETFLKAARAPRSIPSGFADEEAWLVRVLVNIRRDQWRKAAVRRRYNDETRPSIVDGTDAEAALVARATVWSALDVLPPRRRAVVIMHELEGLTMHDIASVLGITAITVRWHLSRGRRDLARILAPYLGVTDDTA